MHDIFPYASGFGIVLVFLIISFYFQKPEKTLNVAPNQFVSSVSNKKISANQNGSVQLPNSNAVQAVESAKVNPLPLKSQTAIKTSEVKTEQPESSKIESSEKVYFCGAMTKKGTPCSRRVRGGGRCWQHTGQTAMLQQEKLLAGQ